MSDTKLWWEKWLEEWGLIVIVVFLLGLVALAVAALNKQDPESALIQAFEDSTGSKFDVTDISLTEDTVLISIIDNRPTELIDPARRPAMDTALKDLLASVESSNGPRQFFATLFLRQLPDGTWVYYWANICTFPPNISCKNMPIDAEVLPNKLRWRD